MQETMTLSPEARAFCAERSSIRLRIRPNPSSESSDLSPAERLVAPARVSLRTGKPIPSLHFDVGRSSLDVGEDDDKLLGDVLVFCESWTTGTHLRPVRSSRI